MAGGVSSEPGTRRGLSENPSDLAGRNFQLSTTPPSPLPRRSHSLHDDWLVGPNVVIVTAEAQQRTISVIRDAVRPWLRGERVVSAELCMT